MSSREVRACLAVALVVACSGKSSRDSEDGAADAGEGGTSFVGGSVGTKGGSAGAQSSGGSPVGGSSGGLRGGNSGRGGAGGSGPSTGGTSGTGDAGADDGAAAGEAGKGGAAGAGNASGTAGSGPGGSTAGGMGGRAAGGMAGRAAGGMGGDGTGPGCTPNPPPQNCDGTLPPPGGVFIDFSTYSVATGAWGNAAAGDITGGTTKYSGWMVTPLTMSVNGSDLRVTGTLPPYTPDVADDAENYAGFLFWSAPCLNAGASDGVAFTIGGTLNGAALKLQVQTHQDYPADPANSRGACVFMDCATRWSECMSPYANVIPPPTPSLLVMPWPAFTNGAPAAGVTPEGIVGFQFQFECQATTACAIDVTLRTISFVRF